MTAPQPPVPGVAGGDAPAAVDVLPAREELARRVLALALGADGPRHPARLPADPAAALAQLEATMRPATPEVVERGLAQLGATGCRVVVVGGPGYPRRLARWWPGPMPLWLFVEEGRDPQAGPDTTAATLAVVGTRSPSSDGVVTARRIAAEAAGSGAVVVSGLARGIDQAAHRGALDAGGATVGVRGTGAGVDYPRGSHELLAAVRAAGALVSPFPPGHGIAHRCQFLTRNVVLAGLADVTVVVEGRLRSGALHTAARAAELGGTVMAVPGSLNQPTAEGPLALLRDGAEPVTRYGDVLDALGLDAAGPAIRAADAPALTGDAKAIDDLLSTKPVTVDELVADSGLAPRRVLAALGQLEALGRARPERGGTVRDG